MEVKSISKYVRISPSKVHDIALLIKGKNVDEAISIIELIPRKGAMMLEKTLKSAIMNAVNNHSIKRESLFVKSAEVMNGPMFRRFRPKARGMAGRIRKRTSHLKVVVTDER